MGFLGFGKPSRSYTSSSSSAYQYDEHTGYPTPLPPPQYESPHLAGYGGHRRSGGTSYSDAGYSGGSRQSSSLAGGDGSRVRSRDVGYGHASSSSLLAVPSTSRNKQKALKKTSMSDLGVGASSSSTRQRRSSGHHEGVETPSTSRRLSPAPLHSHSSSHDHSRTPSPPMSTRSSGSMRHTTTTSHSNPMTKAERQRRTMSLQEQAQVFCAADLAPPPPLSRLPSTILEGDDEKSQLVDGSLQWSRTQSGSTSRIKSSRPTLLSVEDVTAPAKAATARINASRSKRQPTSASSSQASGSSAVPRSSLSDNSGRLSSRSSAAGSQYTGNGVMPMGRIQEENVVGLVAVRDPGEEQRQRSTSRQIQAPISLEGQIELPQLGIKSPEYGIIEQLTPPQSDPENLKFIEQSSLVSPPTSEISAPVTSTSLPNGFRGTDQRRPDLLETPPRSPTTYPGLDGRFATSPMKPGKYRPSLTAEELMKRSQKPQEILASDVITAYPRSGTPDSASGSSIYGSAESHSPTITQSQVTALLAPPIVSVQPPTPYQEVEKRHFHFHGQDHDEEDENEDEDVFVDSPESEEPSMVPPPNQIRLSDPLVLETPIRIPIPKLMPSESSSPTSGLMPVPPVPPRSPSRPKHVGSMGSMPPPPLPGKEDPSVRIQRTTSLSTDPSRPPSIASMPVPANPNSPHYLKWDPKAQRWIMALENSAHIPVKASSRAASVVSSISEYSQPSSVGVGVFNATRDRRSSMPLFTTHRSSSPIPRISRPASPTSIGMTTAPSPVYGSVSRRMSIEPAYSIPSTTLTFLPEMAAQETFPDRPVSRSHSRKSSSYDSFGPERLSGHYSMTSLAKFRLGPSPSRMYGSQPSYSVPTSQSPSENGDEPVQYDAARQSRPGSRYAPSATGTESMTEVDVAKHTRQSVKIARGSGLDIMSAQGEPVPLLGADGLDESKSGYTSLVLPTGAYKPGDPFKSSHKIDHRSLGMPQSTMSTITLSPSSVSLSGRSSRTAFYRNETPTPAHLRGDIPPPVSFSSHQPPPSKISDSQVLVQVYAVALDRFDSELVMEKAANGSGVGKWIPGRSFCGRALDVGADVRVISKGDLVMGLVDIKKSGTLAEYIICERRRIARTPFGSHLSLEQLACLPLHGVTAHRACSGLARGSRALILNAHEGVGSLVAQELSNNGIHVIAQVPLDVMSAEEDAWENGAKEVIADDPVAMINGQHESGFDFIFDTVGGRRIYDAARRTLRTQGSFVTIIGDDTDHVAAGPQVKSGLHALRRAFVKKDKKAINYIHLMPGGADIDPSGQDSRDILELPIMGQYMPKVGMVVPFERAPEAFEELAALIAGKQRDESGAVVVRLTN